MSLIEPAALAVDETSHHTAADYLSRLEQASVVRTLANLMTFPQVRSRAEANDLQLIGTHFDVGTGDLAVYDPDTGSFAPHSAHSVPRTALPAK